MAKQICAVAVDVATFAIDKLYSYRVPDEMQETIAVGSRVLVPFGFGNKRAEAVVLAFRDETEYQLKPILEVLDDSPVLDEGQLKLALWMRDRLYCTVFECIRVMLPAGLWFRLKENYMLTQPQQVHVLAQREGLQGKIFAVYEQSDQSVLSAVVLEQALGKENLARTLDTLCAEGLLKYQSDNEKKSKEQTEKLLYLAMESEQAMRRISKRSSAARLDVIALLQDGARMSQKELMYMTGASAAMLTDMRKKGILGTEYEEKLRMPDFSEIPAVPPAVLSQAQQSAYDSISEALARGERAALLFGVTGSGKTQIYLELIADCLERQQGVIVLVPEIGLTPQVISQFVGRFGQTVAVMHSALSVGERYDSFRRVKRGDARVVIGTRSAVFAPVKNLGMIIMDEEQDDAYKSEQTPRYHARDIAKYRVGQGKAFLVLGSATPSIESYYKAMQGNYPMVKLSERFLGTPLPDVVIADMRESMREGISGSIGMQMQEALMQTLEKRKQAVLFLNRRGNSRSVGCGVCGWVPQCPSCSTTLTYHSVSGRTMCHLCGYSVRMEHVCPTCGAGQLFMETPGTQRVEQELHALFPKARVLRMDADATRTKNAHETIIRRFKNGEADILLGTQMVTKGLDFENVTLVGVLDADQSLYAQNYRARERTFSQITQVIGRAGRRFDRGCAIVQTSSPEHSVILAAARQDYEGFYEAEIETRGALLCPPMADLVVLTATGEVEQQVLHAMLSLKNRLQSLMEGQYADVKAPVLGPVPATVVKVMGRYRYHLTLRGQETARRRALVAGVMREFIADGKHKGVSVFADVNPDF